MSPTASGGAALHLYGSAVDPALPVGLAVGVGVVAVALGVGADARRGRVPPRPAGPGRPVPARLDRLVSSSAFVRGCRAACLLLLVLLLVPLLLGPDLVANPALGVFHVLLVVGLVPLSLLLGPVVRVAGPVRTVNRMIARALRSDPAVGPLRLPERWGERPAALALLALAWQVDVSPGASYLGPLQQWLAAYAVVMLVGAAAYGEEWLARADPFEVLSSAAARLSPWSRDPQGRLVLLTPWTHLARTPGRPGADLVVAVLAGAVAQDVVLGSDLAPTSTTGRLLLLLGAVAAAWVLLRVLAPGEPWTLLPVVVAAGLASHLTYLLEQGRTTLVRLGDPLVTGDGLLDPAAGAAAYALGYRPGLLASLQVALLLGGLVVALLAARGSVGRTGLLTAAWTATAAALLSLS